MALQRCFKRAVVIGALGVCVVTFAQAQADYPVQGQVFVEKGNSRGVTVLLKGSATRASVPIDSEGRFSIALTWDAVHEMHFSKAGYVSKIIEFNTKVPSGVNKASIPLYELKVLLFREFEGFDSVFFKRAVAKIRFDEVLSDFDYDTDYSLTVKKRIEQMRAKKATQPQRLPAQGAHDTNRQRTNNALKPERSAVVNANNSDVRVHDAVVQRGEPPNPAHVRAIPPLKAYYPQGRTVEEFMLDGKNVTRVVIQDNGKTKVLLKVTHQWGPTYYFVDEAPLTRRCVSKSVFERETLLCAGGNVER